MLREEIWLQNSFQFDIGSSMRNLGFLQTWRFRASGLNEETMELQRSENKWNSMKKWNKLKLIEECQPNFQLNKPLADCFCIFWPLRVRPHPESSHERPIFSALGQDSPVSSGCPYAWSRKYARWKKSRTTLPKRQWGTLIRSEGRSIYLLCLFCHPAFRIPIMYPKGETPASHPWCSIAHPAFTSLCIQPSLCMSCKPATSNRVKRSLDMQLSSCHVWESKGILAYPSYTLTNRESHSTGPCTVEAEINGYPGILPSSTWPTTYLTTSSVAHNVGPLVRLVNQPMQTAMAIFVDS